MSKGLFVALPSSILKNTSSGSSRQACFSGFNITPIQSSENNSNSSETSNTSSANEIFKGGGGYSKPFPVQSSHSHSSNSQNSIPLTKIAFIYGLECKEGKYYVGRTTQSPETRYK